GRLSASPSPRHRECKRWLRRRFSISHPSAPPGSPASTAYAEAHHKLGHWNMLAVLESQNPSALRILHILLAAGRIVAARVCVYIYRAATGGEPLVPPPLLPLSHPPSRHVRALCIGCGGCNSEASAKRGDPSCDVFRLRHPQVVPEVASAAHDPPWRRGVGTDSYGRGAPASLGVAFWISSI
ncbi:unnamed protein product, partial [Urochloa humidicola]